MNKKQKIILNYIIGPIIFGWFSYSIYNQIKQQQDLTKTWQNIQTNFGTTEWVYCFVVIMLMFINWGLETHKWQHLVKGIEKVSFFKAYRATFTGQAFAFNTINNLGDFVGRVLYLNEGNRLRGLALSMVGSLSQVIVTFIMGIIALFFSRIIFAEKGLGDGGLSEFWYTGLMFVLVISTTLLTIVYFTLSWLTKAVEKISFVRKYAFLIQKVEDLKTKDLTKVLVLSFLRYFVSLFQYLLMLQIFQVQANILLSAFMVCILLLILAIVPTIALAELGVRGKVSLKLLGLLSVNHAGIVFTAAAMWFINRVFPALAGSLFILGVKLFKK